MYSALRIPERFSNNKLVVSLSIFLFVLPFSEALKHFAFLLLVLVWLNHLTKENDKLRLDILDLIAISIPLLGFVTAALSPFGTMKIAEANLDSVRLFFLWFVVRRINLVLTDINYLWAFTISGTLVGLLLSTFEYLAFHRDVLGVLPSVGHINHTAIYLVFVSTWTTIMLVESNVPRLRFACLLALCFLVFALFASGSRGALGTFCLVIAFYFSSSLRRVGFAPTLKYLLFILSLLITAASLGPTAPYIQALPREPTLEAVLPDRVPAWRAAIIASKENPLFGTGAGTYKHAVTLERLEQTGYDRNLKLSFEAHAHNLFINWIVERGIFSLLLLVVFLLLSMFAILKNMFVLGARKGHELHFNITNLCAVSAVFITIISGIPNTTLHHEHGALAMILLAFGLKKQ